MSVITDAHRAWIAEAVAAPFHTPRRMPTTARVRRRAERLPDLFRDLLGMPEPEASGRVGMSPGDLLRAHFGDALPGASALTLRRRELKLQREAAAALKAEEPAPQAPVIYVQEQPALSEKELVEIEACLPFRYAYGPDGDAARARWRVWISEGTEEEIFSVPLKGKPNHAFVTVVQMRLGWQSSYDCQFPDKGCVGGGGYGPHQDVAGFYLWADREAAIQAAAHAAWSSAIHPTPGQTIDARARIAVRIQAEFEKAGIDVTTEPTWDRRRRLITKERVEELKGA